MKNALPLAHIREPEFVHDRVAHGPGMTQVPLLKPLLRGISKTRDVRACRLKGIEGFDTVLVGEVVVSAELLLLIDMVIKPESRLI